MSMRDPQIANLPPRVAALESGLGLVRVGGFASSGTGQSSVSFDNVFSAEFTSYRITGSVIRTGSALNDVAFRLRSGFGDAISGYEWGMTWLTQTPSVTGNYDAGAAFALVTQNVSNTLRCQFVIDLDSPFINNRDTTYSSSATASAQIYVVRAGGAHTINSSYHGITFATVASNVFNGQNAEWDINIYGYRNGS